MTSANQDSPAKSNRRTGLIVAAVTILAPVAAFTYWAVTREEGLPRIERRDYEAARKKWRESGIDSYDLDLVFVGGLKPKEVHLEVRNGEVAKCLENGSPPSQRNAWDNWVIENQFVMIGEDIEKDERGGFNAQKNVMITLHAIFDPEYGFPRRYHRRTIGASPLQSQWRVVNFKPLAAASTESAGDGQ